MKRPRVTLPAWPLEADDTLAVVGLVAVSAGAYGWWGWPAAALTAGALLLLGYTLREVLALRRSRS